MLPYDAQSPKFLQHLDKERRRIRQVKLRRALCIRFANVVHEDWASILIILI